MTPSFIFKGIQIVSTNSLSWVSVHSFTFKSDCIAMKSKERDRVRETKRAKSNTERKKKSIEHRNEENEKRFDACFSRIVCFQFGKIKMWFHVVFYIHHMMPYQFWVYNMRSIFFVFSVPTKDTEFARRDSKLTKHLKTTELRTCTFDSVDSAIMLTFCWKIYWAHWNSAKKQIVT